jgi:hypothetical protein
MQQRAVYIGTIVFLFSSASFAQDAPVATEAPPPIPRIFLDRVIATGGTVVGSPLTSYAGVGGLGGMSVSSPFASSWVSGGSQTSDGNQAQSFRIAPSLDVRVYRNLLVGGTLGFQHSASSGPLMTSDATYRTAAWELQGLGRVGYLTQLGQGVLLVPRIGIGADFQRNVSRLGGSIQGGDAAERVSAKLETDLTLWIPLRGPLYLSAGPSLRGSTLVNAWAENGNQGQLVQNATQWSFGASAGLSAAF